MSSKNDKKTRGNAGSVGLKPWSVTARLLFLYSAVTFTILSLIVSALFWMLREDLQNDEEKSLKHDMKEIEALLQDVENNRVLLEIEVNQLNRSQTLIPHDPTYIRILDQAGEMAFQSDEMADRLPINIFPVPQRIGTFAKSPLWTSGQNRPYMLMSIRIDAPQASSKSWLIQGARDLTEETEMISDYRRKSLGLLLVGILISSSLAVVVTKFGLRPLREITEAVRHITAERLHQRLESERWPKELSELAGAFDQMMARLEGSFIKLNQFSEDLAHELRTPVNTLMGEAEVALSRNRTSEDYRQVLGSALEEYTALARLIDNLLFLARAENAPASLERRQLDARQEIEAVRAFYEAVSEEKGITVTCQGKGGIMADPILLRRALSNLISNALRHTPQGGKITISIAQAAEGGTQISVTDTGSGISASQVPRIFERFYRVDGARRREEGGTGLGLSIVKSIMSLHGGKVEVESRVGIGTSISLWFPN